MTATRQGPDRSAANLPTPEGAVVTKIGEADIREGFKVFDKFLLQVVILKLVLMIWAVHRALVSVRQILGTSPRMTAVSRPYQLPSDLAALGHLLPQAGEGNLHRA